MDLPFCVKSSLRASSTRLQEFVRSYMMITNRSIIGIYSSNACSVGGVLPKTANASKHQDIILYSVPARQFSFSIGGRPIPLDLFCQCKQWLIKRQDEESVQVPGTLAIYFCLICISLRTKVKGFKQN